MRTVLAIAVAATFLVSAWWSNETSAATRLNQGVSIAAVAPVAEAQPDTAVFLLQYAY